MLLRSFKTTKTEVTEIELVTSETVTSVLVNGVAVASFRGGFSEIAEDYYYDLMRKAQKEGCSISL